MINQDSFAQECVSQGVTFGVNPHFILGVAQFRSGISDDAVGDRIGPFRLTQGEWNANSRNDDFGMDLAPNLIGSARRQCAVFSQMAYRAFDGFVSREDKEPTARELYLEIWADAAAPTLDAGLQEALDDCRDLLTAAADAVLDNPASVPPALQSVGDETTRPVTVTTTPGTPPWYSLATKEIGVREVNNNSGPVIARYRKLAQCGADHDPWCAIFANAMLASCKPVVPGTRSALAQSFSSSPNFTRLGGPAEGAVVVFWRKSPRSGSGHVGFYSGETSTTIYVLGGNENNQVQIEPFLKSQLIGYFWPASFARPAVSRINIVPRLHQQKVTAT